MSFSEEHEMVDNSNGVAHLFITEGPSTTTHQAHPHNRRKIVELENGELTRHASSAAGVAMIGLKEDSPFEKVFLSEGQCMPLQFA
jgi:hypothetical protein